MKKRWIFLVLLVLMSYAVVGDCIYIPPVDRTSWITHSKLNVTGKLYYNSSEVCTVANGLCNVSASNSSADGNNFTTQFGISGVSTKSWSLNRTGMSELTGTFTDIDTWNSTAEMRAATNNTLNADTLDGQEGTYYNSDNEYFPPSNAWDTGGLNIQTLSAIALGANNRWNTYPVVFHRATTIDQIGFGVNVVNLSVACIVSVYNDTTIGCPNGLAHCPGSLVANGSYHAASPAGGGIINDTIPTITIPRNSLMWMTSNCNNTGGTMRLYGHAFYDIPNVLGMNPNGGGNKYTGYFEASTALELPPSTYNIAGATVYSNTNTFPAVYFHVVSVT